MLADQLREEIEKFAQEMRRHPLLQLARRGGVSAQTATNYLANTRFLVSNSQRHLRDASLRAATLGQHELASHFAHKFAEEYGHEAWADADILEIGRLYGNQTATLHSVALAELVAYLDEAIRVEPARYLAYTLYAEYFTVLLGPEWVAALDQNCGVPRSAMSVVTQHVELDRAHVLDGMREIDALVTDGTRFPALLETALTAMSYFERFCDEVYAQAVAAVPYPHAS